MTSEVMQFKKFFKPQWRKALIASALAAGVAPAIAQETDRRAHV